MLIHYDDRRGGKGFLFPGKKELFWSPRQSAKSRWREAGRGEPRCSGLTSVYRAGWRLFDTPRRGALESKSVLWRLETSGRGSCGRKMGRRNIYLVTSAVFRGAEHRGDPAKSGSEGEAQIRVPRGACGGRGGHSIPGFSPGARRRESSSIPSKPRC